ncbi:helix-turn-helix domain-containing protein [Aeromonas enteropelogenes]|uniref:helix-turn-helix domain-containing protein n=1 Tax=Aeromonas enteropelogenes TaxID=29489 RepID=UPI0038D0857B
MERIQSINRARIKWCCADRGIAQEILAHEIGIAPAIFAKIMAGEAGLTFNQLRNLATFFGRGVLFFIEQGDVNEEQVHSPQFRTLANQKPELSNHIKLLIERVEQQRATFLALREELDPTDVTSFLPPDLTGLKIQDAAKAARQWLKLKDRNNFDSYRKAIEACGLLVFRSNGYHGKWQIAKESPILGFSLYHPECPVIVVKKQKPDSRQSFTLMHELGHLLLHRASSIDDEADLHASSGTEQEANAFAGHLLVPDDFLLSINDHHRPDDVANYDDWLKPQRDAWGVSGEMILRRLMDSGRLSSSAYATYREWSHQRVTPEEEGGNRGFRNREPIHIFGDGYVRTVLDALNTRRITLAKASNYLDNLKITDLHKLERYYAGV